MFYFSSPSDASSPVKYVRFSSRRHLLLGKRNLHRTATAMERPLLEFAWMARFSEPVFCDNVFFPFSVRPGSTEDCDAGPANDLFVDDDESGGVALEELDYSQPEPGSPLEGKDERAWKGLARYPQWKSDSRCETLVLIDPSGNTSTSASAADTRAAPAERVYTSPEAILALRYRHPRPENDEIAQEEEGRRQRVALAGEYEQSLHYFQVPSTGSAPLRRLTYQRSCDSIRSISSVGSLPQQTRDSIETDTTVDLEQDRDLPLGLVDDGLHTIMDDMAQSAWAVDDLRHQNDVLDFCSSWERSDRIAEAHGLPVSGSTRSLREALASRQLCGSEMGSDITREDTKQGVDVQGIRWNSNDMVTDTRDYALQMRALVYPTIYNTSFPDAEIRDASLQKTDLERYYRFRHYSGSRRPAFAHYQLRHLLCSSGRDLFYSTGGKVMRSSLAFPRDENVAMDLSKSALTSMPMQITSLATSAQGHATCLTDDILLAGGFDGEYAMLNLASDQPNTGGRVNSARDGVVTHIHTFNQRSSGLLRAAFCSNDLSLRLMDIRTQRFTNSYTYDTSLNCAAPAPDGRLRILGGDSPEAFITDAESGTVQATLRQHTDDIFACAWSPNGRLVATGAQDGKVVLWDSRNWSGPLTTLNSSMTCARSLHFTSDSAALVAAESEDVVRIHDTTNWTSKQDLRFFGTIAGVALVNGGDEIVVGNGDRTLGGLLRWQRTYGSGFEAYECDITETFDGYRSSAARKTQKARRRGMMRNEMLEEVFV